jgi:hypothetical protein
VQNDIAPERNLQSFQLKIGPSHIK